MQPKLNGADLLKKAIDNGATFGEFLRLYREKHKPTKRESLLIEKAQQRAREGELEVDDCTICSGSGEGAGGEYVLAWVWVED